MSFRLRLTVVSAAAVALAVALASVIVYFLVRSELRGQIDEGLETLAARAEVGPGPALAPGNGPPPGVDAGRPSRPGQLGFAVPAPPPGAPEGIVELVTAEGEVLRARGEIAELDPGTAATEVAAGRREAFLEDRTVDGEHLRVLTAPAAPGTAIFAARSLEEVDSTMRSLVIVLGLVALGGAGLAAALGLAVTRAAAAPVGRLTETAEQVARTRDLSRRIEDTGPDELGRLASSFNAMLAELQDSERARVQLVADASHELRTPLSSLRTNLEVLARPDGLPRTDRERLIGDAVRQIDELGALVANLVELARDEEPPHEPEELRLDELVEAAVVRARGHFPGIRFKLDSECCVVRGSRERLDRAVANLLDNAAKWSPPGGEVEVAVRDAEVSVRDHGPGIPAEDLPRVFDRFYRAPAARSRPGAGLGLAIVRQVAETHGGSVEAESAEGGGARLRLALPSLTAH